MAETLDLALALDTARRAVGAAARAALRFYQADIQVHRKADRSLVTRADLEAEAAILAVIRAAFPTHSILAEESGASGAPSESRWLVDPLDGTSGFSRGGSFWGPLVAVEHQGEVVAGAMALPALGETYWAARGIGCFRNGEKVNLSDLADWSDATLSLGQLPGLLEWPHGEGVQELIRTAASARCYGDLAGCAMVLQGRAEVWLEAGVKPWDLAPLAVLVEEAGGRFTDFRGLRSIESGNAAATNGPLHDHVLATLNLHRG